MSSDCTDAKIGRNREELINTHWHTFLSLLQLSPCTHTNKLVKQQQAFGNFFNLFLYVVMIVLFCFVSPFLKPNVQPWTYTSFFHHAEMIWSQYEDAWDVLTLQDTSPYCGIHESRILFILQMFEIVMTYKHNLKTKSSRLKKKVLSTIFTSVLSVGELLNICINLYVFTYTVCSNVC